MASEILAIDEDELVSLNLPELIAFHSDVVAENVPLPGPPEEDSRTLRRILESSSL